MTSLRYSPEDASINSEDFRVKRINISEIRTSGVLVSESIKIEGYEFSNSLSDNLLGSYINGLNTTHNRIILPKFGEWEETSRTWQNLETGLFKLSYVKKKYETNYKNPLDSLRIEDYMETYVENPYLESQELASESKVRFDIPTDFEDSYIYNEEHKVEENSKSQIFREYDDANILGDMSGDFLGFDIDLEMSSVGSSSGSEIEASSAASKSIRTVISENITGFNYLSRLLRSRKLSITEWLFWNRILGTFTKTGYDNISKWKRIVEEYYSELKNEEKVLHQQEIIIEENKVMDINVHEKLDKDYENLFLKQKAVALLDLWISEHSFDPDYVPGHTYCENSKLYRAFSVLKISKTKGGKIFDEKLNELDKDSDGFYRMFPGFVYLRTIEEDWSKERVNLEKNMPQGYKNLFNVIEIDELSNYEEEIVDINTLQ